LEVVANLKILLVPIDTMIQRFGIAHFIQEIERERV
jgi:hypothetical protein